MFNLNKNTRRKNRSRTINILENRTKTNNNFNCVLFGEKVKFIAHIDQPFACYVKEAKTKQILFCRYE